MGPAVNRTQKWIAGLVRCSKIPHCPPLHQDATAPRSHCTKTPLDQEKIPSIANYYPQWVLPMVLNLKTLALVTAPEVINVAANDSADTEMK